MSVSLKKFLFASWIILFGCLLLFKGVQKGWNDERSDFSNYYSSSKLILNGENISDFYNNDWFEKKAAEVGVTHGAKFTPFPPITAFLYLPLTFFSELTAKRILIGINLLLIVLIVHSTMQLIQLSKWEALFLLSLFCIPIVSNIGLGQCYLLFTWLILVGLRKMQQENFQVSGSIFGVLAAIKYFPLLYLASANHLKSKRVLIGFGFGLVAASLLPILFNGFAPYEAFVFHFWKQLNGDLLSQGQFAYDFQSIDALLANFFIYDEQLNPNPIIEFPILKVILKWFFLVVIVSRVILAIRRGTKQTWELNSGLVVIGGTLLLPVSANYHLLFLFPAILLIVSYLKRHSKKMELGIVLIFIFLICNLMYFYIPTISFNSSVNHLIHFPRLFLLIGLFFYLNQIQKRHLQLVKC